MIHRFRMGAFCIQALAALLLLRPANADAPHAAFGTLTARDTGSVTICVPSDAEPTLRFAARELQRYIGQMCGAMLEVREGALPAAGRCLVLRSAGGSRSASPGELDAFSIRTRAGLLTISGRTDRAVLYGTYALLERLGCRWLAPGADDVPRLRALRIPALAVDERPVMRRRGLELIAGSTPAVVDWMAKLRLNVAWPETYEPAAGLEPSPGSMRAAAVPEMIERGFTIFWGGHVIPTLFPVARYGDHPEYFAQIAGKRLDSGRGFSDRGQLCTSNPAATRILAANTVEFLRKHPWIDVLFLWGNDTTQWCECAECRKLEASPDRPSSFGGLDRSATYCRMVRLVSDEVHRMLPAKRIGFNHYYNLEEIPRDVTGAARPDAMPRRECAVSAVDVYRQCDRHTFADASCPKAKRIAPVAAMWRPYYSDTVSWSYYWSWNFMKGLPISMVHKIPADFRFLRSLGIDGVMDNVSLSPGSLQWSCNTLNMYIYARSAWNPNLDVDAEVSDYLRHLYGAAAPPMVRFWALMDACTRRYGTDPAYSPTESASRTPEAIHGWMTGIRSLIPNRAVFERAMALLRDASSRVESRSVAARAGDRAIAFRIQVLRDVLERWEPPARDYSVFGFLNGGGAGVDHVYEGDRVGGAIRCSVNGGANHADCFWPTPAGSVQLAKPGDAVEVDACANYGAEVVGETAYRSGPGLYQADSLAGPLAAPGTRSVTFYLGNLDDDRSGPRRVILTVHDGAFATAVRSSPDNVWAYGAPTRLRIEYVGLAPDGERYRYLYRRGRDWTELAAISLRGKLPYAAPMHYWAGLEYGRKARFPLIDWATVSGFTFTHGRQ